MSEKTNLYNGSRDVDVENVIDRMRHSDSAIVIDSDYDSESHPSNVQEALNRLRTLQLIDEAKKSAERIKRIQDISKRERFSDAFANPAARTGWGEDNLINATEYPMTRLTQDWQLLTSLYRTSWIVQRVCNVIPEDALADLTIEAPGLETKELHLLEEEIRSTHLRESILEGLRWGRLYGGAAAIIMISGQEEDLSLPVDVNNITIGAFRGLYIVDRWSGIYPGLDLVDNDRDPDFGLPEYYEVRDETSGGTYRVHHSRVLRFCGTKMPYWEQVAEQYWGTSAIESMYDELIKRDNVAHNIANLTFKACLSVLQVENLDQMFATSNLVYQRRMYAMLSAINSLENSLGIRLVNKGDDIQQLQYSFSGLPEVMDSAMMDMAGATSIPVTRLFGRSPAGMNSTGESDEKMYRQTLEQERSVHIDPALERLIPIVCRSAIGYFPAGCKFKYPSLIEMSPEQKAQIIDQRSQAMERLFQANLIPGDVVLEAYRNSQLELDITSNITDEHINAMKGKYFNDLQQQADPYGGAMQTASEAGVDSGTEQVDENGNPIDQEQEVDESENPIQQPEMGRQESPGQERAKENQYKTVINRLDPSITKNNLLQAAMVENLSPEELEKEELTKQMNAQQETIDQQEQEGVQAQRAQRAQQAQQQEQQRQASQQEQRQDHSPKYRRIKHINNWDDEDFRFEKFKKTNNKRSKWN
jgi:phage-related protein (TIGR01555 family)